MSDLRAAAQQALEALEHGQHTLKQVSENQWESRGDLAMQALHAALAEQYPDSKHATIAQWRADKQRKPLTEVELDQRYYVSTGQMLREQDKRLAFLFARAIERAHGIGGSDE